MCQLWCAVSIQSLLRSDRLPAQEKRQSCVLNQGHIMCLNVCGSGCVYVHIYQVSVCIYKSTHTRVKYGESSPHKGFTFICSTLGETAAAVAHPNCCICIGVKQEGGGGLTGHLVCLINGSVLLPWVLWYKWRWWGGVAEQCACQKWRLMVVSSLRSGGLAMPIKRGYWNGC